MILQIPTTENKLRQENKGDFAGNILSSWNLDLLSNPGAIRVSPQTLVRVSNVDDADLVYPVAFVTGKFDNKLRHWAICDKVLFKTSNETAKGLPDPTAWEQDSLAGGDGTPTDLDHLVSDGVEWNGNLIVSSATDLHLLTGSSWDKSWWDTTLAQAALSANPHPLGKGFNNLLLIGDGNVVHTIDPALTVSASRLTFLAEYQVVWIRSSISMIYIGCRNKNGGRAKVFAWDGYSQNFNYDYKIDGSECFAGVIKDEIPSTINERGELLELTGAGFTQVATLPIFTTDYNLSSNWTLPVNIGRNGMIVQDNRIHILVQASVNNDTGTLIENQLGGVWVYDPIIGLHHRYSLTKDTGANIIDYGSPVIVKAGALLPIDKVNGNILIGCSLYLADGGSTTTLRHLILTVNNNESDTVAKLGYFTTPKILSSNVEEEWQKIWMIIKPFINSTSKIVIKYRTEDKVLGVNGTLATWYDVNAISSAVDFSKVSTGDEIEILSGEGSGLSSNLTSINLVGGNYEMILDDSIAGASGTVLVRASNWKKCGEPLVNIQSKSNFEISIGENSTWIQFKVVMFFTGKEEVKKLIIKSEPYLKIT